MFETPKASPATTAQPDTAAAEKTLPGGGAKGEQPSLPREIGGRDGPEPTRFGDWEKGGRCIDF